MHGLAFLIRFAAVPFLIVVAVATAAVGWRDSPWLQTVEGQFLDLLFQVRGPRVPHSDVMIIAIDDRSVEHFGGWPLERTVLADLVGRLNAVGASAIGLDLLLVDRRAAPDGGLTAGDRALVDAVAGSRGVVLPFAVTGQAVPGGVASDEAIRRSAYLSYVQGPDSAAGHAVPTGTVLAPFAELAAVSAVGSVAVPLEADGAVRRWSPVAAYGDRRYPAMAVELARSYLALPPADMLWIEGRGLGFDGRLAATDSGGRLALNSYGPSGSFRTVSLVDFMSGRVPAHTARNRIVLIGATATGVGDTYLTAFDSQMPGVELVASMTENLLHGEGLARTPQTMGLSIGLMALFVAITAAMVAIRLPGVLLAGIGLVLTGWAAVVYVAFAAFDLWLDAVPVAVAILATGLWAVTARLARDRRERRADARRSQALARFVAPALAERLANRDTSLIEVHEATAAVMFVDLVGFTEATESIAAADTLPLLSRFYRLVEAATEAHDGIVDKFIGDGAMVLFGIGEGSAATAAADAVRCALRMIADFGAPGADAWLAGGRPLHLSIGIHHGTVALAEIGGARQVQFTATGDTVNVAARLEELTRELGSPLVVSADAVAAAQPGIDPALLRRFAPLPPLQLRGRSRPLAACVLRPAAGVRAVA
ncbi:MAG: adenylate/guanylate cyclase domain-containing protein [Alphaproteobacteria bacterium]